MCSCYREDFIPYNYLYVRSTVKRGTTFYNMNFQPVDYFRESKRELYLLAIICMEDCTMKIFMSNLDSVRLEK